MSFEEFLKEASFLLGLQWRPFLRKGIKRRIEKRIKEIGIANFKDYFLKIKEDTQELKNLSIILTITISRFFRDQAVFNKIATCLFPDIIDNYKKDKINIWSIGCASGEELYSLALIWKDSIQNLWPDLRLFIIATDIDVNMINRKIEGKYKWSSLKEVPEGVLKKYFRSEDDYYILDESIREIVIFKRHDIIHDEVYQGMDIILCRNLTFTYFSKSYQIDVLKKIANSLITNGYLIIGKDENIPFTFQLCFYQFFRKKRFIRNFIEGYILEGLRISL